MLGSWLSEWKSMKWETFRSIRIVFFFIIIKILHRVEWFILNCIFYDNFHCFQRFERCKVLWCCTNAIVVESLVTYISHVSAESAVPDTSFNERLGHSPASQCASSPGYGGYRYVNNVSSRLMAQIKELEGPRHEYRPLFYQLATERMVSGGITWTSRLQIVVRTNLWRKLPFLLTVITIYNCMTFTVELLFSFELQHSSDFLRRLYNRNYVCNVLIHLAATTSFVFSLSFLYLSVLNRCLYIYNLP